MIIFFSSSALAFAGLLLLAALHKVRVLFAGQAPKDPLLVSHRWISAHATALILMAAIGETIIAVLLVVTPPIGFTALSALLISYISLLLSAPSDSPCSCFGDRYWQSTRYSAIVRDIIFLFMCFGGIAWHYFLAGTLSPGRPSLAGAFLSLVIVGAALLLPTIRLRAG